MAQKSTEDLLHENARLRGDLLTFGNRVNHDLRTPLGSILNSAELLKEMLAENNLSPAPLNSLFASVDEMMRLIKSVSLLARASAIPVAPKKMQMSDAVYRAWQRAERQISKCGASVEISDSWPEITGVDDWLEFIWWQFLSNALQHGGKKIQIGWCEETGAGKFFVRDNGCGISPERRAKLFQPFEQLHQSDSARGMGLPMARRLVELQNGNCGYEFDGGSVFYFTLPGVEAKKLEAVQRQEEPA
jgi:signal transduction histidine kinase